MKLGTHCFPSSHVFVACVTLILAMISKVASAISLRSSMSVMKFANIQSERIHFTFEGHCCVWLMFERVSVVILLVIDAVVVTFCFVCCEMFCPSVTMLLDLSNALPKSNCLRFVACHELSLLGNDRVKEQLDQTTSRRREPHSPSVHPRSCCCRLNVSKRCQIRFVSSMLSPTILRSSTAFSNSVIHCPSRRRNLLWKYSSTFRPLVASFVPTTKRIERGLHDSHHVPSLVFLSLSVPSRPSWVLQLDGFAPSRYTIQRQLWSSIKESAHAVILMHGRRLHVPNTHISAIVGCAKWIDFQLRHRDMAYTHGLKKTIQAENVSEPNNVSSELNGATKHCLCK